MGFTPYDQREGFIWVDDALVPWQEAKVHYLTHALHYATLVFEGERAYNGKIFKSEEHSQRLIKSAEIIGIDTLWSVSEIEEAKQKVMEANKLGNAYIRAAIWRGAEQMGIDVTGTKPHLAIAAWDWGSYFSPEIREKGIALKSSKWAKPAPNTAPTESKCAGLYVLGTMAKREAQEAGYNDAFMLDYEGYVAESSGANIFLVKDGALHTPIADRFLNGITRQTVIELAKNQGIAVEERRIKPDELPNFQEVFLTGTAAEITPVGKIDDLTFKVGPVTRTLTGAYEALVQGKKP